MISRKRQFNNITKEDVIYDLKRLYNHARQVYEGHRKDNGLSKEGAFRRMQVFNYAINNLNNL